MNHASLPAEIEAVLEALDEEYVNIWPALRILIRHDRQVHRAVELLENGSVEEAVGLLRQAGLEDDQIEHIVSTVTRGAMPEA